MEMSKNLNKIRRQFISVAKYEDGFHVYQAITIFNNGQFLEGELVVSYENAENELRCVRENFE